MSKPHVVLDEVVAEPFSLLHAEVGEDRVAGASVEAGDVVDCFAMADKIKASSVRRHLGSLVTWRNLDIRPDGKVPRWSMHPLRLHVPKTSTTQIHLARRTNLVNIMPLKLTDNIPRLTGGRQVRFSKSGKVSKVRSVIRVPWRMGFDLRGPFYPSI